MPTQKSKHTLLGYVAGGALFGALAILAFVRPDPSLSSEKLNSSLHALAGAVAHLEQQLDGFGESLPAQENPILHDVVRSSLDAATAEQLVLQLGRLEETLQTLAGSLSGGGSRVPRGGAREAAHFMDSFPANTEALVNLKSRSSQQLSIGFLGWSYREILNEFGSPNIVENQNGGSVRFYYVDLPGEGEVRVNFEGGYVVRVESGWD